MGRDRSDVSIPFKREHASQLCLRRRGFKPRLPGGVSIPFKRERASQLGDDSVWRTGEEDVNHYPTPERGVGTL